MRASYKTLLRQRLLRAELGSLARLFTSVVRLRFGLAPRAPLFITMALTYRCNLRCAMCDFPARKSGYPSSDEILDLLESYAKRGTLAVGFTGGEPTLRKDLETVIEGAKALGLIAHLNTNGSFLDDARIARLFEAKLDSINLSLDGACASTHDELRGMPGSFDEVLDTTERLLRLRKQNGAETSIRWVMALGPRNAHEVEREVRLAAEKGVDGIGFLPLHPLPGEEPSPWSEKGLQELRDVFGRLRQSDLSNLLDNSKPYLEFIPDFLEGSETPLACSAPNAHLAIDPKLETYPCVPLMTAEKGQVGRAQDPWNPAKAAKAVDPETCRRCWWNCHRELDQALGKLR